MFKITTDSSGEIVLKNVYNGVGFITRDGEEFSICMRDTGYEFTYGGVNYEAKNGVLDVRGNRAEFPMSCLAGLYKRLDSARDKRIAQKLRSYGISENNFIVRDGKVFMNNPILDNLIGVKP